MADEAVDILDPTTVQEALQAATEANPVLGIPDQVAAPERTLEQKFDLEDKLASALQDILPTYWDAKHPSADLFEKAKEALQAYQDSI